MKRKFWIMFGVFATVLLALELMTAFWPCCRVLKALLAFSECTVAVAPALVLSLLAYQQDKRLADQEACRNRENTKRPFFVIDRVLIRATGQKLKDTKATYSYENAESDALPEFTICLKNAGDGPAVRLTRSNEVFGEAQPTEHLVAAGDEFELRFRPQCFNNVNPEYGKTGECTREVVLTYENIIGVKYRQTIEVEQAATPKDDGCSGFAHSVQIHQISGQVLD